MSDADKSSTMFVEKCVKYKQVNDFEEGSSESFVKTVTANWQISVGTSERPLLVSESILGVNNLLPLIFIFCAGQHDESWRREGGSGGLGCFFGKRRAVYVQTFKVGSSGPQLTWPDTS